MRGLNKPKRIIFYWLPPILWMGLIFFLSSFHKLQVSTVGWQDFITRKLAHFTEYAILYVLFYRGLKNTVNWSFLKLLIISFLLTIGYALTDEYHQTFVSGRTGKTFDIGVDSLGALFGLILAGKIFNLLPEKYKFFLKKISS